MNAGIYWTGTRDSTTIQYNTLNADDNDRLINLSDGAVATNFLITYNAFTISSGWGNWFATGVNAGCNTTNVLSYNSVVGQLTSWLDLGTANQEDITWSNNDMDYGIVLNETSAQDAGEYGDIVVVANTFAGAPSTSAFEIAATVGNTDFEGDTFTADDVIIYYNDFTGYAVGGNETVRFLVTSPTGDIDARYNYWGTALDGPYNATSNPYGTDGDVDDDVTYRPWIYKTLATTGDTVAEIYANQVPAYASSTDLSAGWNAWSVPIGLDGQYNTWAELYTLTSLPYTFAYRFDPTSQTFVALATTSTYAIVPGEAFYIKVTTASSIPYCYDTTFSVPSRALGDGFNLVGGGLTTQDEIVSCASIATAGGTAGYSHIVSPPENAAGSWVYIAGAGTAGNFVAGEGYWVFLPIARTLGLFDPTPAAWVPLP